MKIGDILTLLAVVFLLVSVTGFILDRPVLISYVTSDSMTPTLNKGDLFLINPFSKGKTGDIIVFKMNGHWTVHRIYAETSEGYITKGDNNVATDQQGGRSDAIRKEDVVGTVVTIFDKPIKIPYVGMYIQEFSKSTKNLYIAIVVIVLGSILLTAGGKDRVRKRKKRVVKVKYKTLYTIVSAVTIAIILISIVATWGTVGFNYASTLAGGQKEGWYLPNTEFDRPIVIENKAFYPMYYILSPKGDRIALDKTDFMLMRNEKESINVHVKVPVNTKIYYEQIDVYTYPPLLPTDLIKRLWNLNPYLPLVAFSIEIAGVLAIVYFATGSGEEEIVKIKIRRKYI
ncbi:signal peptidase I [Archaeoglobus sp.]